MNDFWRFHPGWNQCFHPLIHSFPSDSRDLYDDFPSDWFVAVRHLTVVVVAVNGARGKPGRWKTNGWRHRRRHSFLLPVPSSSPSNAVCGRAGDRACVRAEQLSCSRLFFPSPGAIAPILYCSCSACVWLQGQFPSCRRRRRRLFYKKNLSFGSFERKRERERERERGRAQRGQ
jgi:hypothetical protein